MFNDKVLMITGGTGSFGNTVLNHFMQTGIREIRIFSRDETKQDNMRIAYNNAKIKFHIGDVRDYSSIRDASKGVDFIFHAAALKQVPSCEFYPMEAVKTNVLGAENVMHAALENQVRRVIVLSTDKAVYPINAMGLSKAMMEKVMVAKARMQHEGDTVFCATRYGNVMASRGSVIPLFVAQAKEGRPLTLTDPNMTRFLMSLDDSVDLVLFAYQHAAQGDVFVQKAPACTVGVLAQAIKELFNSTSPIHVIGTRHGEKVYESLVSREEMAKAQDLDRYYRIPADNRDLNYNKYLAEGEERITQLDDYTSHNTTQLNVEEVKTLLLKLDYMKQQLAA